MPGATDAGDPFESVWQPSGPDPGIDRLWYHTDDRHFLAPATETSPYSVLGIADPDDPAESFPDLWRVYAPAQGSDYRDGDDIVGSWYVDVARYQSVEIAELEYRGSSYYVGSLPEEPRVPVGGAERCFGVPLDDGQVEGVAVLGRAWDGNDLVVEIMVGAPTGEIPPLSIRRVAELACEALSTAAVFGQGQT